MTWVSQYLSLQPDPLNKTPDIRGLFINCQPWFSLKNVFSIIKNFFAIGCIFEIYIYIYNVVDNISE